MARERQITVTLSRRAWAEFQRRLDASGLRGQRGADSTVLNEWLEDTIVMNRLTVNASPPTIPLAPAPEPTPDADEDDFGFDASKL